MKRLVPYKLPRIFPQDADMNKYWFVHFDYLNPETGKYKRFKYYGDLNRTPNKRERVKKAEDMKAMLTNLLVNGYNPFENEVQEEKRESTLPATPQIIGLAEALEKALVEKCMGKTHKTEMNYRGKTTLLLEFISKRGLSEKPIVAFRAEHAREVLQWICEERGIGPYTRNIYLVHFKSLFTLLIDMDLAERNPFAKVKSVKAENESHTPYSMEQVEVLRGIMTKHDSELALFTQFIFYAFIRPNELRQLQVKHVNLAKRLIQIPQKSKTGEKLSKTKGRFVEICASLHDMLLETRLLERPVEEYLFPSRVRPDKPNGVNTMYNRHLQVLKRAGLTDDKYTLYGWKHSGVIAAYMAGLDILTIQQMCGHSTVDMTYRYLRKIGLLRSDAAREKRW